MLFRNAQGILSRIVALTGITAALLLVLYSLQPAAAQSSEQEYQVKAALLYNFGKFVEWPANAFTDPAAPLGICIIGKDPIINTLDGLKEKRLQGRPIIVREISSIEQAEGCHILFINSSEKNNLQQILRVLQKKAVLTVGDTEDFAKSGVMINLVLIDNKIGFEINPAAAEQASVKISSKLLTLGKIIKSSGVTLP